MIVNECTLRVLRMSGGVRGRKQKKVGENYFCFFLLDLFILLGERRSKDEKNIFSVLICTLNSAVKLQYQHQ